MTDFSSYFHAVNCAALGFKPKMAIRQLGGRRSTHRAANPALQFDLNTRPGDANIKSLSVTLPSAFEIDQRHLGNLCTEKELATTECAGRQQIGKATTTTPLLDQPLCGPGLRGLGLGRPAAPGLPPQRPGQPRARAPKPRPSTAAACRRRCPVVPDAPVGHFRLTVFGGKQGYLANTRDLCGHKPVAKVGYTAQNRRTLNQSVTMKVACNNAKKRAARGR